FLGEFRFVGKAETLPVFEVLALESNASENQKELCERFAVAMDEMRSAGWRGACDSFASILHDYPEDGPSRFHLIRCRRFAEAAPEETPWIIHMDAK
ncbi:MAG: hypothetical protein ACRERU_05495, partial [Methylococcales bacterium]